MFVFFIPLIKSEYFLNIFIVHLTMNDIPSIKAQKLPLFNNSTHSLVSILYPYIIALIWVIIHFALSLTDLYTPKIDSPLLLSQWTYRSKRDAYQKRRLEMNDWTPLNFIFKHQYKKHNNCQDPSSKLRILFSKLHHQVTHYFLTKLKDNCMFLIWKKVKKDLWVFCFICRIPL